MHCILFYEYVEDIVEKRGPHRAAHIEYLKRSFDAGEVVLAGALADPVDGAVVVFRGATPEPAERFAKADPYVLNGLVTKWRVRKWSTVIGDGASLPAV
jgi:uncharacterized protein YciI